jgi:hypothetical protein
MGALSNQDNPRVGGGMSEELSVMLDPTPLLGAVNFAAVGRSTVAGRATLTADATVLPPYSRLAAESLVLHRLGSGADHYRLRIDIERGVLLEAVELRDGQPFRRISTTEIAFDHPIANERFVIEPPPGEAIQSIGGRPRPQLLSVPQAQQRAPFTVLIPDLIPSHWRVHCVLVEASTQRCGQRRMGARRRERRVETA